MTRWVFDLAVVITTLAVAVVIITTGRQLLAGWRPPSDTETNLTRQLADLATDVRDLRAQMAALRAVASDIEAEVHADPGHDPRPAIGTWTADIPLPGTGRDEPTVQLTAARDRRPPSVLDDVPGAVLDVIRAAPRPLTKAEVADALGQALDDITWEIRRLLDLGLIRWARTHSTEVAYTARVPA